MEMYTRYTSQPETDAWTDPNGNVRFLFERYPREILEDMLTAAIMRVHEEVLTEVDAHTKSRLAVTLNLLASARAYIIEDGASQNVPTQNRVQSFLPQ